MDDNEFSCDYLSEVLGYRWMLSGYISSDFRADGDWYTFVAIWIRF